MSGLLLAQSRGVEPAQSHRARSVREGWPWQCVVEGSAWAHIHARDVASAAIAVAEVLGGCCTRFALAIALGAISLDALPCEGVTSRMTLQLCPVAQIAIDAEGFLEIRRGAVGTRDEIGMLRCLQHRCRLSDGSDGPWHVCRMYIPGPSALGAFHHMYAAMLS